jgi:hypothetical protein
MFQARRVGFGFLRLEAATTGCRVQWQQRFWPQDLPVHGIGSVVWYAGISRHSLGRTAENRIFKSENPGFAFWEVIFKNNVVLISLSLTFWDQAAGEHYFFFCGWNPAAVSISNKKRRNAIFSGSPHTPFALPRGWQANS